MQQAVTMHHGLQTETCLCHGLNVIIIGWWHSLMVGNAGLINKVNQHRAWLVHGWVTVSG